MVNLLIYWELVYLILMVSFFSCFILNKLVLIEWKLIIIVFYFRLIFDEVCFNIIVVKGSYLFNGIIYL